MFCSSCGASLGEGATACSDCGASTSIPAAPVTPEAVRTVLRQVATQDWLGPLRVSSAILATAGVLAILIGLGMRPAIPGFHWTFHTTIAFFAMLWGTAFGADITAHATISRLSASGGAGTFPLTITFLALGVGAWLFHRCTRGLTTRTAVFGFAGRTALLTAIPPLVVSLAVHSSLSDLLHLVGVPHPRSVEERFGLSIANLKVGVSELGSFFLTLFFTALVLSLTALLRSDLLTGSAEAVRRVLVGPITGAAALLLALIPAGLVGAIFVWVFRRHGDTTGSGAALTWHEWMNIVAAVIAYAPNIALWMISLGSAGRIGVGAQVDGRSTFSQSHGLHYLAGSQGINGGMWVSVALAPIVLAVTAYAVVWLARGTDRGERLRRLATWAVSLLVVLPCVVHYASLHAHDSATAYASVGPTAASVVLIVLYALLIAVALAFALRLPDRAALSSLRKRLDHQPGLVVVRDLVPVPDEAAGPAEHLDLTVRRRPADAVPPPPAAFGPPTPLPPRSYQVGDVVNGWRWDGSAWVPAEE